MPCLNALQWLYVRVSICLCVFEAKGHYIEYRGCLSTDKTYIIGLKWDMGHVRLINWHDISNTYVIYTYLAWIKNYRII